MIGLKDAKLGCKGKGGPQDPLLLTFKKPSTSDEVKNLFIDAHW